MVCAGIQEAGRRFHPKAHIPELTNEFKRFSLVTLSQDTSQVKKMESGKLESLQQKPKNHTETSQSEKYSIHKVIQAMMMKFFTKRSRLQS
jgi:hypothetical protein